MERNELIFIIGFAGSLRKGSYNKMLLHAASRLLPENTRMEVFELDEIPPFNQDLEYEMPEIVARFKKKIREADALLIATPEYNGSVSGVLKNALDWASRPYGDNSLDGKPVAIMSASLGMLGGARAQRHLRDILSSLNAYVVNKPEVLVNFADEKFDIHGNLKDEETKAYLRELLENLVKLVEILKAGIKP
ncbi:MAG: NAD(P)H-dependent oxidoreductase [Nitrososphaeria archaeon]|nr:NAD(P)H-dependent oxidoreductase [Aigarchaeota archaeon]MCX8187805.1 NAD(P)H-dependent oxidoreductase [Nitrososphaeria archaeon]